MITEVEVVAGVDGAGRTVLEVLRGRGALAPRRTGPHRVHLVASAAGPLGGDTVRVSVLLRAGARLQVCGVGATLALPGRSGEPAAVETTAKVGEGAVLDWAPEPVIVAAGAHLRAATVLEVADGAVLTACEQIVLGRCEEEPGRWRGSLHADLAGRPWVRQVVSLGEGAAAWDALWAPRVLVSRLWSAGESATDAASGSAVRAGLAAGGGLVTAAGADLAAVTREADALTPAARAAAS